MMMPTRTWDAESSYRFGFNGMEKDDEMKGAGNSYTTEFRILDSRIARWFSSDPIIHSELSPYNLLDDNPIYWIDPFGSNSTGYTVDDKGSVEIIEGQNENDYGGNEYDVIFDKNSFVKGETKEEEGFKVETKGVLNSLSKQTGPFKVFDYDDTETGEQYYQYLNLSKANLNSEDEAIGLFKFLADASKISEWRLNKYSNGVFELSTFHCYDTSPEDDHLNIDRKTIDWMIHSHPTTPAGKEEKSFGGDASASTYYNKYFVYFPKTSLMYRLSKVDKTTVKATKMNLTNGSRSIKLGIRQS